jgi:hypothetical protein
MTSTVLRLGREPDTGCGGTGRPPWQKHNRESAWDGSRSKDAAPGSSVLC